MTNKLPNFLIVWAPKSGTTSLFYRLVQHPQVYIPARKELRFFSNVKDISDEHNNKFFIQTAVKDFEEYKKFFEHVNPEQIAIWEASPEYLFYYEESIKNIKKYLWDEVKIIIVLREPVSRTFSQYKHTIDKAYEEGTPTFEESLAMEEERKKKKWFNIFLHKTWSFYYDWVKAYLENFKNIKIFLLDDIINTPEQALRELYDFLWINNTFKPDMTRRNIWVFPKDYYLNRFLNNMEESIFIDKFKMFVLNMIMNNWPFFDRLAWLVFSDMVNMKSANIINFNEQDLINNLRSFISETIINDQIIYQTVYHLKKFNSIDVKIEEKTKKMLKEAFREDILKLQKLIWRDLSTWL